MKILKKKRRPNERPPYSPSASNAGTAKCYVGGETRYRASAGEGADLETPPHGDVGKPGVRIESN
jgi:hypothetical protein